MAFPDHVYEKLRTTILGWDANLRGDIYAISFYISDFDDDPRQPTLTLGYNTIAYWHSMIPTASDADEAKWNYAFWPQTEEAVIGDAEDAQLRQEWVKSLGLWYSDQDETAHFDRTIELGEKITLQFVALTVRVAQRLHQENIIQAAFPHPIPIIVHELEYYDTIARQTEEANPPGFTQEFSAWVMQFYE